MVGRVKGYQNQMVGWTTDNQFLIECITTVMQDLETPFIIDRMWPGQG